MMRKIKDYVENAEVLAQEIVNAWGLNMEAGNGPLLTGEFNALLDKACLFRTIRSVADNHREFGILSDNDAAEEIKARQGFAEAYMSFEQKHTASA